MTLLHYHHWTTLPSILWTVWIAVDLAASEAPTRCHGALISEILCHSSLGHASFVGVSFSAHSISSILGWVLALWALGTPNPLMASYVHFEGVQAWLLIPVIHFPLVWPYTQQAEDSQIPPIDMSITNWPVFLACAQDSQYWVSLACPTGDLICPLCTSQAFAHASSMAILSEESLTSPATAAKSLVRQPALASATMCVHSAISAVTCPTLGSLKLSMVLLICVSLQHNECVFDNRREVGMEGEILVLYREEKEKL